MISAMHCRQENRDCRKYDNNEKIIKKIKKKITRQQHIESWTKSLHTLRIMAKIWVKCHKMAKAVSGHNCVRLS